MVTILKLPNQPIPKQLTARAAPSNLQEHTQAFLNHFNRDGFDSPEHEQEVASTRICDLKTVGDVLLKVRDYEVVGAAGFKSLSERIFQLVAPAISRQEAQVVVATALGYSDYAEVVFRKTITNKNFRKKLNEGIFDAPRTEAELHLVRPYNDVLSKIEPYLGHNLQFLGLNVYLDAGLLLEFLETLGSKSHINWPAMKRHVADLKRGSYRTITTGHTYNLVSQLAGHSNHSAAKNFDGTGLVLIRDTASLSEIIQILKD